MSYTVPTDWGYEPDDPSVGIFGESFFHEAEGCTNENPALVENVDGGVTYKGSGSNRTSVVQLRLVCVPCGASAIVEQSSYDPEGD